MSSSHANDGTEGKNERPLWIALILTTTFLIAEVVGGVMTNSLALISDAAHMFTDSAALAVSLAAIRIGKRAADNLRTFGYYRFEILAAAFNAVLLFMVAMYILYEAYQRINNPPEIQTSAMLIVATLGLAINLISMRLLANDKDKSLNVKGAYLEVWSDMLGSVGVIAGAIIIRVTGWPWVDSAIAVLIGLWVLPRTWTLLKESMNILLEGVPDGLDLIKIADTLGKIHCVSSIHELHVWAITSGKASLTAHVVTQLETAGQQVLLSKIRESMAQQFNIHHITIQFETTPCVDGDHSFGPQAAQPGSTQ